MAAAEPVRATLESIGWRTPREEVSLGEGGVEVWYVETRRTASELRRLEETLSEGEILRASAFRRREDRDQFVARRGALRAILARYLATRPERLRFGTGAHGKPVLHEETNDERIEFSQTRSEGLSLIALALSRRLGVDVEPLGRGDDMEEVAARFFSAREKAALGRLPRPQRQRAAMAIWVRKEAFLKARGVGLSVRLDRFSVSIDPRRPACVLDFGGESFDGFWTLCDLDLGSGWLAALAVEGSGLPVRRWAWEGPSSSLGVRG